MSRRLFWPVVIVSWPVIFLVSWKAGSVPMGWRDFFSAVAGGGDPQTHVILFDVRLPRILLAALAGAGLSLTGGIFQALLRNALADPYVLGVSGGSALGATLSILLGVGPLSLLGIPATSLLAFLGALTSVWIVHGFASERGVISVHTMLLAGVSLQAMCSAIVLFLYTLLDPFQLMEVFTWLMGRVPSPTYASLAGLTLAFAAALAVLLPCARALNALAFGDRDARSLGFETERLKLTLILSASLLTGTMVAFTGLIGFVGIVVPHVLRLLVGPDYRRLLPGCVAVGSLFLAAADTLARSLVPPAEIPVGVLTALTGGPFFLFLLWRNRGSLAR